MPFLIASISFHDHAINEKNAKEWKYSYTKIITVGREIEQWMLASVTIYAKASKWK